uniref:Death domain-containing protein n=1 Tax=Amphimedon queenslandica TaxID=400682 RepID=A0A1X7TB67_AMPQE
MATKTSSCSSSSLSLFASPLTIDQLIDVLNLLKRCGFPQRRWKELGLTLGLHKNTLDAIERNHPGDVSRCLKECLSQWLSRADNVDSKGGATFDSLSDALKSMNENAAADKLDQEKRNAMISGNDTKRTNDARSTATGTNKPLIGGPPLSPIALMNIPDDRPTVSELIEFHELLIKGQLEESLPLLDADTIRKIRNAVNDHEGMSLLIRAFEEHPTLLHEMRVATGKIKGINVSKSVLKLANVISKH